MKVLSAPGTQCPREEDPTKYIPDSGEPIEVPDTMYYRRLMNDGSLVIPKLAARTSKTMKEEVSSDGK